MSFRSMNVPVKANIITNFFIILLVASTYIPGSFANAPLKIKESLDLSLKSFDYNRPASGAGPAGTFLFGSMKILSSQMAVNVNNKGDVFNSTIFLRPNFIGINADNGSFGLGLPLTEKHFLHNVLAANLVESSVSMNEDRIDFSADFFRFTQANSSVQLKNFGLFCKKHPEYRKNDFLSIMYGCLYESNFNGRRSQELSDAIITATSADPSGKVELNGLIDLLNFGQEEIQMRLSTTSLNVNDTYFFKAQSLDAKCEKNEVVIADFKFQDVINNCLNSVAVGSASVALVDNKSKTNYRIHLNKLAIKDEEIKAEILEFNRLNTDSMKASPLSLVGVSLSCYHEETDSLPKTSKMISDCLTLSKLHVDDVIQSEKQKTKQLDLTISQNSFNLTGRIKPLMFWNNFGLAGQVEYSETDKLITITVEGADLPIPIFKHSLTLAMFFIKMGVGSNEGITVDKKNRKIYIKLEKQQGV